MKHIGLVGCSAEGAALCYKIIVEEGRKKFGGFIHPEVTLHTFSLQDYMQFLTNEKVDWEAGGNKLIESVEKLKNIGADFVLCPDNTIHHGVDLVRERIPLPFLHICEVVADIAKQRNFHKVLLLGTRFTMRGTIYQRAMSAANIECILPNDEEVTELDRIVWEELISGIFLPQSIKYYQQVIEKYKIQGCQAAVLGCTEIPLIINDANSSLPTLDSTHLLAIAALDMASV